jgi:hypothetical protein
MTWKELTIAPTQTHHMHKETGVPAYPERFDEVLAFHSPGLAPVQMGEQSYHVDMHGKPVYFQRFQRCFGFYDGIASVITEKGWRHILPNGDFAHGKTLVWSGNFQEGICTIRLSSGQYMHIDKSGSPLYTQTWFYAGDFRYGIGVVQNAQGVSTHIDTTGDFLHGKWFQDLDVYHKGYARAKDGLGWMHIDRMGNPIYKARYATVEPFYNGQARVETLAGGLLVIDELGQVQQQLRASTNDDFAELSADMVGFWKTQTIATGVELGVFDFLPATLTTLAQSTDSNTKHLSRLLGGLGELSLVYCEGDVWKMTNKGQFLATNHPKTLRDAALEFSREFYQRWTQLTQAIRSDWTAPDVFAEISEEAERVKSHTRMIQSYANHDYSSIASGLLLTGDEHIVDAGGGSGVLAKLILQQFPDITITILERPEIVEIMKDTEQLRWQAVDIFEPWNIRADVVLCSRILHDWNDQRCLTLLQVAKHSLKRTGRLLIIEMVLSEGFGGRLSDLHLLISSNGKERTLEEYRSLLDVAGLKIKELRDTDSLVSIIEAEHVG